MQLLVEAGADLRAINCDKELAVDLAENDECRYGRRGEESKLLRMKREEESRKLSIMMTRVLHETRK